MIDYHCHILSGVDDGATDMNESLQMARVLAGVGFSEIHCTPHCIKGAYDTVPASVRQKATELQTALDAAGIDLSIRHGMEYYIDEYLPGCVPDDAGHILVEAPFQADMGLIMDILTIVVNHGFRPVIAHPERNAAFAAATTGKQQGRTFLNSVASLFGNGKSEEPGSGEGQAIKSLQRLGCRFQGNIGSFAGYYGDKVRRQAIKFLEMGLYSCLGSDAHRIDQLEDMLVRGLAVVEQAVGKEDASRLLTSRL